ncbi:MULTISPECIES: endolytic transglycosylase MltG [Streptomyces]|uniref:endolytic transglycosylase MltG n=1 Tax=Streptomyces TaxID=1883 RepID=UPI0022499FC7|nr:endolytic transglycosylase MltG [Streptomyces sp. JHD 1]MCX2969982.1 endolytic transglycosylase MltG [Streptomyces sp. JHD 1]
MTEYGRGSQPWHPEDPLYGDREWDGATAAPQPEGWDAYGQQPHYPQQQDAYGNWQNPHPPPPPGLGEPYGQQYGQQPPQPYGDPADYAGYPDYSTYYPAPDAYPPPQPQHTRPPEHPGGPGHPGQGPGHPGQGPAHPGQGPGAGWGQAGPGPGGPGQGPGPGWDEAAPDPGGPPHAPGHPGQDTGAGWDDAAPDAPDTAWGQAGPDGAGHAFFEAQDGDETLDDPQPRGGGRGPDDDEEPREPSTRAERRTARGRRDGARRRNRAACLIVGLVLVGGGAAVAYGGYSFYQSRFASAPDYSGAGTGEVTVTIPEGAIAADMAKILAAEDVVKSEAAFIEVSNADEASKSIQPGIYTLRQQMSAAEALKLMLDPASQTGLIIPEGLRATRIYELIDEQTGSAEGTTEKVAESADLGLPEWADGNVEGFLFPSRYSVSEDSDPEAVLKEMVQRAKDEFAGVSLEAEAAKVDRTPYEVLIIASLIQAEAQEKDDFGKVSQVIYNRLQPDNTATNGKLDFDSTINYALDRSTLDVSVDDTNIDHPFNTYKYPGLPPGPIDNPGHQALEAALNPTDGPWFYFVTVKPGDTRFSESYEEHQEHVLDFNAEQAKKREEGGE